MDTTAAQFPYPWQRCKIIHLVRHGQAMHNVEGDINREALLSPHLFDAELSPLGLQQVDRLRKEVHASGMLKRIELVVTSPLYRTMQTAIGVFGSESLGEGGNDNFSAISAVSWPQIMAVELCRDKMMDGEEDSLWNPDVREPDEKVSVRMAQFMKWLWTRPEQEIVIVSHGIILQHILYVLGNDSHPTVRSALCQRFGNCELRSVVIVDKSLMGSDSPL
ncbi:hypothetical protein SCA6_008914 [Theobroma cacao]